jgi:two-component sensor histidine kinase
MTYYRRSHVFSDSEIDLAVTIGRQLGFGLQRIRAEEARRRAEQAHELLLKESRHRIKNTLATVQGLAGQTLRHTPPDERQAFIARLHALGEAHDLLNIGDWDQALLRQVVKRALKPFADRHATHIVANGPDLWLSAQASLLLTMGLHELATNATKYGALSNGMGKVQITWQSPKERKMKLYWRETGGPHVTPPETKGFGSLLIDQSFSDDGESCFVFRPEGLICSLTISV